MRCLSGGTLGLKTRVRRQSKLYQFFGAELPDKALKSQVVEPYAPSNTVRAALLRRLSAQFTDPPPAADRGALPARDGDQAGAERHAAHRGHRPRAARPTRVVRPAGACAGVGAQACKQAAAS
jgi:hypothetical protein